MSLDTIEYTIKNKPQKLNEFRELAQHGDGILYAVSSKMIKDAEIKSLLKTELLNLINSNAFLASCEIPMKFKINDKCKRIKNTDRISLHNKADQTEVWIWFLYINYGASAVERFVKKQLSRYYTRHFK